MGSNAVLIDGGDSLGEICGSKHRDIWLGCQASRQKEFVRKVFRGMVKLTLGRQVMHWKFLGAGKHEWQATR
jgi:hypothetical protein